MNTKANNRSGYDENDDNTQVFYFNVGIAAFSILGKPDEIIEF